MDFIDELKALGSRIPKQLELIQTEEATKNALIMPFIKALGYNVFDPREVVPEYIADVGVKKGEKVDYAIMMDGKPVILFECKWHGANLDQEHASQLHRYFHTTEARIGVLTNGVVYRFFSDLDSPNKMDTKPFLELNMLNLDDPVVESVKKFSKTVFVLEDIVSAASEMKYRREIKRLFAEQYSTPSDEFVKFFAAQVYSGKITQKVCQQFADFTKKALREFVSDRINERFKSAMSEEALERPEKLTIGSDPEKTVETDLDERDGKIVTTEDEIEGFYIVKAILREIVDGKRISLRDTQSYAGILLDDNNRKPICRLRFNGPVKYISIVDSSRKKEQFKIEDLNDIYSHAERLKKAVLSYENPQVPVETVADG